MINIATQRMARQGVQGMGRLFKQNICSSRCMGASRTTGSLRRSAMKTRLSNNHIDNIKMQQASVLAASMARPMSTQSTNNGASTHTGSETGVDEVNEEEVDDTRSSTTQTSEGNETQEADTSTEESSEQKVSAEGEEQQSEEEDDVEALKERITKLEEQLKELSSNRARLLAEMENVRHIAKRDVESAKLYSISKFAKQMLDVADNLRRALQAVPAEELEQEENKFLSNLYDGVKATDTQLRKILEEHQIHEVSVLLTVGFQCVLCIKCVPLSDFFQYGEPGDDFDPNIHEAMFQVPSQNSDQEPGKIAQVSIPKVNIH